MRDGELEVVLAPGSADEMLLKVIGPGEYVGEMGLILQDGKRTATVRSRTPSNTWVMSRARLRRAAAPLAHYRLCHGQHSERATGCHQQCQLPGPHAEEPRTAEGLRRAEGRPGAADREGAAGARAQGGRRDPAQHPPGCSAARSPGFDFGARILPARRVGGDFYDVFTPRSSTGPASSSAMWPTRASRPPCSWRGPTP